MRLGIPVFAAALALSVVSPVKAPAQIIVGRSDENVAHREQRYGWCSVKINGENYVSGVVFLPQDDIYSVFLPAYKEFAKANLGQPYDEWCADNHKYSFAAESDIERYITKNPQTRYIRQGWTGGFPTRGQSERKPDRPAAPVSGISKSPPPPPLPKGPTPNQLKYQRELAEYQQRLAEIETEKAASAAKLASNKAAAQQLIDQHRRDMEANQIQLAAAEQARRRYEQELAAQQRMIDRQRTNQDREALVDWPEAVAVCELNPQNPQSKFGNWKCNGPLQFDYAKLGNAASQADPKALFNVSNACGGQVASVRDLGMVNGYRVFGCSFGLHPDPAQRLSPDPAVKFGLGYIVGRNVYRCPKYVSYCRTR